MPTRPEPPAQKHTSICQPPKDRAHPLVKFLHFHMRLEGMTRTELAIKTGVAAKTLESWWAGNQPGFYNLEAALAVFEYEIVARPAQEARNAQEKTAG